MVLLNGADGMSDMFAKALTMGGTGLGLARQLLSSMNQDGTAGNGTGSNGAAGLNGAVPPRTEKVPVEGDGKQ
jgi:hypothetical protein